MGPRYGLCSSFGNDAAASFRKEEEQGDTYIHTYIYVLYIYIDIYIYI